MFHYFTPYERPPCEPHDPPTQNSGGGVPYPNSQEWPLWLPLCYAYMYVQAFKLRRDGQEWRAVESRRQVGRLTQEKHFRSRAEYELLLGRKTFRWRGSWWKGNQDEKNYKNGEMSRKKKDDEEIKAMIHVCERADGQKLENEEESEWGSAHGAAAILTAG